LSLICRHSLLVSDSTPAAIYHAYTKTTPTLLIDESSSHIGQTGSSLNHLLRAGTTREVVMRMGKVYQVFGPKVIAALELPDDHALRSRCLVITMSESSTTRLRDVLDPQVQAWAKDFRNQAAYLRLTKYKTIRPSVISGSENLRPRARDLLACLAAPFADDKVMAYGCRSFVSRCIGNDQDVLPVEYRMAITLLLAIDHIIEVQRYSDTTGSGSIYTGKFGELLNNELRLRGERIHLNAKKVGSILTSLGIEKGPRNSGGIPIVFDLTNHKRIHKLAKTHGTESVVSPSLRVSAQGCDLCEGPNTASETAGGENAPVSSKGTHRG
jgi:hypothetical protein